MKKSKKELKEALKGLLNQAMYMKWEVENQVLNTATKDGVLVVSFKEYPDVKFSIKVEEVE